MARSKAAMPFSVWPVAMLMVANEMQSGCALLPQVDPMYGEHNASEAEQARRIVKQLPARSIVLADANFGIYSVAYHSTQSQHDFLFRLTKSRFKPLRRRAELIDNFRVDPQGLDAVGRMAGNTWVRTGDRFELIRPK